MGYLAHDHIDGPVLAAQSLDKPRPHRHQALAQTHNPTLDNGQESVFVPLVSLHLLPTELDRDRDRDQASV